MMNSQPSTQSSNLQCDSFFPSSNYTYIFSPRFVFINLYHRLFNCLLRDVYSNSFLVLDSSFDGVCVCECVFPQHVWGFCDVVSRGKRIVLVRIINICRFSFIIDTFFFFF